MRHMHRRTHAPNPSRDECRDYPKVELVSSSLGNWRHAPNIDLSRHEVVVAGAATRDE